MFSSDETSCSCRKYGPVVVCFFKRGKNEGRKAVAGEVEGGNEVESNG